jgi:glycerophosphoryl diester phosphodiesterase
MYGFYLENYGQNIAKMLYDVLAKYNLETVDKCKDVLPIIVECFEGPALQYFGLISDLPLIRLMSEKYGDLASVLLPDIATYAHGIGPREVLIFSDIFWAGAKGLELQVHPWTLKDDELVHTSNPIDENLFYMKYGVDGMFVEFPHMTKTVYDEALLKPSFLQA